jgi:hypothetical protein
LGHPGRGHAERDDFDKIIRQKLGPSSSELNDSENYPPNVDFGDVFKEEDPPDDPIEPETVSNGRG